MADQRQSAEQEAAGPNVAELGEIEAIKRLKARYCLVLDAKDWRAYRALFTDDAQIGGAIPVEGAQGTSFAPDEFVAAVERTLSPWTTFHMAQPQLIELTGEGSASGLWAYTQSGFGRTSGYYNERYVKRGAWRIAAMHITMVQPYSRDDPHLALDELTQQARGALVEQWGTRPR